MKQRILKIVKKQQNGIKNKEWLLSTKNKFKSNYPSSQDIKTFLNYKSSKNIEDCKKEIIGNLFKLVTKTFTETLKKIISIYGVSSQEYTQNIFISEYKLKLYTENNKLYIFQKKYPNENKYVKIEKISNLYTFLSNRTITCFNIIKDIIYNVVTNMLSTIIAIITAYKTGGKYFTNQQKEYINNIKQGTYLDNKRNFLDTCNIDRDVIKSIITNNNNNKYQFIIKNILNDPVMDYIDQKKKQPLYKNKNLLKQPDIDTEIPEQEQTEEETIVNNTTKYKGKNIYTNTDINYWC